MYLVITYDISNNKARKKIMDTLESYWFRVQESVFELELTKNQYERLKRTLNYWLEYARAKYSNNTTNEDSIKFYVLSKFWEWNLDWRIDWMWDWYKSAYFEEFLIL